MFVRASTVVLAVIASALAVPAIDSSSMCDTGNIQCCNQVYDTSNTADMQSLSFLGDLLGPALGTLTGIVGLGCTPVTVIGTGTGASCTSQPVCCAGNKFDGLVNVGCTPINVNV